MIVGGPRPRRARSGIVVDQPDGLPESRGRQRGALVEQLFEEGFAALVRPAVEAVLAGLVRRAGLVLRLLLGRWRARLGRRAPLDDLVELAAIEPDAAAGRAIVDLDAMALGHDERTLIDRAKIGLVHGMLLDGSNPIE
jgi:hypothetical protein